MQLISNVKTIRERFDIDVVERLLFTAIRRDSQPLVTPMLLRSVDGDRLVARQQETGNLVSAGMQPEDLIQYEPWATIDARVTAGMSVAETLVDALEPLIQGGVLEVDDGVVFAHYRSLAERFRVGVARSNPEPIYAYELDESLVLEWFQEQRRVSNRVASRLVDEIPHLHGLSNHLNLELDTRFSSLKDLAHQMEVEALLISAPPNFSELTGLEAHFGSHVLSLPGLERIVLLTTTERPEMESRGAGAFASLSEAVLQVAQTDRVAVEEQWISATSAIGLESVGVKLVDATDALARWRDARDCEDLGSQVVAARASVICIEGALEYAKQKLAQGDSLTERDIYAKYLDLIVEFRRIHDISLSIEPYFANLTASERMLFPGPPTDHLIQPTTKCVQLDAGVQVSMNGVVLATSDMARSMPLTEEGERAYTILTNIVRGKIITSIRPGTVCEQVHATAMQALSEVRLELESAGVMASDVDFVSEYRKRNVGHLMGKQESFVTQFRPGDSHVLSVGAIGAAELPWRFGEYSLAAEDMWFIGADRTFITTLR